MSDLMIYRFQPDAMDPKTLRTLFVGEENLLRKMREEIQKAVRNRTPRYYLVVGPRGIGKSHFITLLYHDLKKLEEAISVKLSEEEFSVYRVSDFFSRIFEEIEKRKFSSKFKMDENELVDAILEDLKKKDKMIIIFAENLNQVLENQMEEKDVKQLKSIFQQEDMFIVVATSPLMFKTVSQGGEPFYNFFDIKHLRELTEEEVKRMLKITDELEGKSANIEQYYAKIDSIVKLTGGSPRIVILLYDLMKNKGDMLDIEKAFFKILDEYTPYYQDVFKILTGQKRRIFDILISIEPATPKEIAEAARLDNNTVITQLRRLEKDGYVISHRMGRNTKYEVRERLFRLWREQRQALGRKKISILIEFIKLWYSSEEREKEFLNAISRLKIDKKFIKTAGYLFLTFSKESKIKFMPDIAKESHMQRIPELLDEFIAAEDEEMRKAFKIENLAVLAEEEKYDDFLKEFETLLKGIGKNRISSFLVGTILLYLNKYNEALHSIDEVLDSNPENAGAWYVRGISLTNLHRYEEALEAFDRALGLNCKDISFWIGKGNILGHLQQYEEALEAFDRALEIDSRNFDGWNGKGQALKFLGQYEEALEAFDRALGLNGDGDTLINKATIYLKIATNKFKEYKYINGKENVTYAMNSFLKVWDVKEEEIKRRIADFLRNLIDSKHIEAVEISLEAIYEKEELAELLEVISTAVEIIRTKNLKKYYELQIEKRDIVADIVKKLTGSEELLPEQYKRVRK
jgi:tetratricopeptide (TPR) repeat protein